MMYFFSSIFSDLTCTLYYVLFVFLTVYFDNSFIVERVYSWKIMF